MSDVATSQEIISVDSTTELDTKLPGCEEMSHANPTRDDSDEKAIINDINYAKRRLELLNHMIKQKKTNYIKPKISKAPIKYEDLKKTNKDVLKHLSQYCIVDKERVKFYEEVFLSYCEQTPRVSNAATPSADPTMDDGVSSDDFNGFSDSSTFNETLTGSTAELPITEPPEVGQLTAKEILHYKEIVSLNHSKGVRNCTVDLSEEYLTKLENSLQILSDKEEMLITKCQLLNDQKFCYVVDHALLQEPDKLSRLHPSRYQQLKVALGGAEVNCQSGVLIEPRDDPTIEPEDYAVYNAVDPGLIDEILMKSSAIQSLNLQNCRVAEKLQDVRKRQEMLLVERNKVGSYSSAKGSKDFNCCTYSNKRGIQSALKLKIHSVEKKLPVEHLLSSLSHINNSMMTSNEFYYIEQLLDLPGQMPLSFHLFTVIAALSEKIVHEEPFVKKYINTFDCDELISKLKLCKNLFQLIGQSEMVPDIFASSLNLQMDLIAGGLSINEASYIVGNLSGPSPGMIDFLVFIAYIPLFTMVHRYIINNPL